MTTLADRIDVLGRIRINPTVPRFIRTALKDKADALENATGIRWDVADVIALLICEDNPVLLEIAERDGDLADKFIRLGILVPSTVKSEDKPASQPASQNNGNRQLSLIE